MIEIDKDIVVPSKSRKSVGSKYGLDKLQLNESIHFAPESGVVMTRLATSAHNSKHGKFTIRTVGATDPKGIGFRIWKIK